MQDNADPVLLGDHDVALASIEKVVVGKSYLIMPTFIMTTILIDAMSRDLFYDKYLFLWHLGESLFVSNHRLVHCLSCLYNMHAVKGIVLVRLYEVETENRAMHCCGYGTNQYQFECTLHLEYFNCFTLRQCFQTRNWSNNLFSFLTKTVIWPCRKPGLQSFPSSNAVLLSEFSWIRN